MESRQHQDQEDDHAERRLTISNPIVYSPKSSSSLNGDFVSSFTTPSLSFVYFLQTEHDKIIINCKEAAKLLAKFARVDIDVYVSPLCYDYASGRPSVVFKHAPKTFNFNVILPGRIPQPAADRPPYGLGQEMLSLDELSLCNTTNSSHHNSHQSSARTSNHTSNNVKSGDPSSSTSPLKRKAVKVKPTPDPNPEPEPNPSPPGPDPNPPQPPPPGPDNYVADSPSRATRSSKRKREVVCEEEDAESSGNGNTSAGSSKRSTSKRQTRSCKLNGSSPKVSIPSTRSTRRNPNPAF